MYKFTFKFAHLSTHTKRIFSDIRTFSLPAKNGRTHPAPLPPNTLPRFAQQIRKLSETCQNQDTGACFRKPRFLDSPKSQLPHNTLPRFAQQTRKLSETGRKQGTGRAFENTLPRFAGILASQEHASSICPADWETVGNRSESRYCGGLLKTGFPDSPKS